MSKQIPDIHIEAVIFDLDGLLLDTEPLYLAAYQQMCERFGKNYEEHVRAQVIGKAELLGAQIIVDSLQLPISPHDLLEERDKVLNELFPTATALKGAAKLAKHLFNSKVPIAVATSSNKHSVKLKLTNHSWFEVFGSNIVTGDNPKIKKGKPAPDIFLAAADALNVDPSKCLVFEDSVSGVEAGRAAGMTVVSVPDVLMLRYRKSDYEAKAHLILNSLEEFEPQLFHLPPFPQQ